MENKEKNEDTAVTDGKGNEDGASTLIIGQDKDDNRNDSSNNPDPDVMDHDAMIIKNIVLKGLKVDDNLALQVKNCVDREGVKLYHLAGGFPKDLTEAVSKWENDITLPDSIRSFTIFVRVEIHH